MSNDRPRGRRPKKLLLKVQRPTTRSNPRGTVLLLVHDRTKTVYFLLPIDDPDAKPIIEAMGDSDKIYLPATVNGGKIHMKYTPQPEPEW